MSTALPTSLGNVIITDFRPPPGCQNPHDDPAFPQVLDEVGKLMRPPIPLRVVEDGDAWYLADRRSWLIQSACLAVGSGIKVVPPESVVVVEAAGKPRGDEEAGGEVKRSSEGVRHADQVRV